MTSETTDKDPAGQQDGNDMRASLIKRLVIAGGLVAVLLGAVAMFDRWSQPAEERDLPVYLDPVPVAPKKLVTQPLESQPATVAQDGEVKPESDAAADKAPVPAAVDTAPAAVLPPPEVAAKPSAEPQDAPRLQRHPQQVRVLSTPIEKPALAAPKPAVPAEPEMTSSPPMAPNQPSARLQALPERKPVPAPPLATEPAPEARLAIQPQPALRPLSGFLLQAGIFSSVQRAEELHARLTISGVPSTVETRVQVGPFKTRQEAEAAQVKLRELGVESILLPPKGKR